MTGAKLAGLASTQVSGRAENLFFAPIYFDAPPGTTKPGCMP
jgi:hypothetical protein